MHEDLQKEDSDCERNRPSEANKTEQVSSFTEPELDTALTDLEDRGLLGWDRRANRYDLHPLVRGAVFSELDSTTRNSICCRLYDHFASIETPDWHDVESVDDLLPALELYHTLIELGRYDEAFRLFQDRLKEAMLWRLSASRLRIELIERLFPDGTAHRSRLTDPHDEGLALGALASSLYLSGQPASAAALYGRRCEICERLDDYGGRISSLCNLSDAHRVSGNLYGSEFGARRAFRMSSGTRQRTIIAWCLYRLGIAAATCNFAPGMKSGLEAHVNDALAWALQIRQEQDHKQGIGYAYACQSEVSLWRGDAEQALSLANNAWELVPNAGHAENFVRAARLQGTASLRLLGRDDILSTNSERIAYAQERLQHALTRSRASQLVVEEIPTLIALAELHWRIADLPTVASTDLAALTGQSRGHHLQTARDFLTDVWEGVERGPYPLFHADALNILASIERAEAANYEPDSESNLAGLQAAATAAQRAYAKAWCQGPPFSYAFGLHQALAHLTDLRVEIPQLPPFEESRYEPLPTIKLGILHD